MVPWGVERRARRAVEQANWTLLVELARKHGAVVTQLPLEHGLTPLHHASFKGKMVAAGALLDCGADVGARTRQGATPLHAAARGDRPALCELLLKRGADVDAVDMHGCTALHEAAWRGHRAVVKALIAHGANPNLKNAIGHRPLDLVRGIQCEKVKKLLSRAMQIGNSPDDVASGSASSDGGKAASDVTSVDADVTDLAPSNPAASTTTVRFSVP